MVCTPMDYRCITHDVPSWRRGGREMEGKLVWAGMRKLNDVGDRLRINLPRKQLEHLRGRHVFVLIYELDS